MAGGECVGKKGGSDGYGRALLGVRVALRLGGSRVGGWMVEVLELSEGWGAEAEAENGVP